MGASALVLGARALGGGLAVVLLLGGCAQVKVDKASSKGQASISSRSPARDADDAELHVPTEVSEPSEQEKMLAVSTSSPPPPSAGVWTHIQADFGLPEIDNQLGGCAQVKAGKASPSGQASISSRSAARDAELHVPADVPAPGEQGEAPAVTTPSPPPSAGVWTLIRAGFALPEIENHPRVQRAIESFAGHQAYFERIAKRARPYLAYILQELEQRSMPTELALLPIVESGFRPFAYSAGHAAGIWQFIPSTARYYGLKLNWWYDARRDVIASTQAALDYLQQLNELFAGNWLLAIAAYNAGQGTVRRAMKDNAAQGQPTDFWHLDLPSETETYVPRLLALRHIVAAPAKYGVQLPPIPSEIPIAVVELQSQIGLALAARLAGISLEKLYWLNPGYNRWATPPKGPHRLVLPVDRVAQFKQRLAAIPPDKRVHWRRHRVRPGETLIELARRYDTTPAILKTVNGLQGSFIRAGSYLIIPLASRPAVAAFNLNRHSSLVHKAIYVVQQGDTLWEIAHMHRTTVSRLRRLNQIAPKAVLHPGQKLLLRPAQPTILAAFTQKQPSEVIQSVRYTVQQGDSLYQIAERFSVTVSDLRRWNDLSKSGFLQPGQQLRLKVDVTQVSENS